MEQLESKELCRGKGFEKFRVKFLEPFKEGKMSDAIYVGVTNENGTWIRYELTVNNGRVFLGGAIEEPAKVLGSDKDFEVYAESRGGR